MDPVTRRSELVTGDFPVGARLVMISDDGRYLLTEVSMPNLQGTFIYDLQTGTRQGVAFPIGSVIAR